MKHIGKLLILECVLAPLGLFLQIFFFSWNSTEGQASFAGQSTASAGHIVAGIVAILINAAFCAVLITITARVWKETKRK